jgi:hypothetical protein
MACGKALLRAPACGMPMCLGPCAARPQPARLAPCDASLHHAPPTHIPLHTSHTPLNMHNQMPPSLAPERRSFIDPWLFDCSQRVTAQDPGNVSLGTADEPMDISHPASLPVTNALHHVSNAVIEEAFGSVAQTGSHVNANTEAPLVVGAYPGSLVRSAIVSPWDDAVHAEEITHPGSRQQQESVSQPQRQLDSAGHAAEERTGPSSRLICHSRGLRGSVLAISSTATSARRVCSSAKRLGSEIQVWNDGVHVCHSATPLSRRASVSRPTWSLFFRVTQMNVRM